MTFSPGGPIAAADITTYLGSIGSAFPYPDAPSCAAKINALWGVGFGIYGVGQTVPTVVTPGAGDIVRSQTWLDLRSALTKLALHQNTAISGFPLAADLQVGDTITATGYDWQTAINAVDSAYGNVDATLMAETPDITSTRIIPWNTQIQHEIEINFGTEDAARFFFNSGSELRFGSSLADTSDPHSTAWINMLSLMGRACLGATATTQTGSGGTPAALGYRTLTTTYQTIFSQSPLAPYAADSLDIQARVENVMNINGGNGSVIRILISFNDASAGDVDGTLVSETFVYKPDGTALSVSSPVFSTVLGIDGGSGPSYYSFLDVITTTVTDYNLLTRATAAGYDGSVPLYANIQVANGGAVISSSTSSYAMTIPTLLAQSQVILTLDGGGFIVGKGGNGGTGAPSGVCGCAAGGAGTAGGPALLVNYPTLLQNYGIIGGGGGGGGGGGAECEYIWNASAGGGGGGGGFGAGGGINGCGVTGGRFGQPGQPGTLYNGGNAGLPGNFYTAAGGNGGNIGFAGSPGQTLPPGFFLSNGAGGAGGAAGAAIVGNANLQVGSSLGDVRGSVS